MLRSLVVTLLLVAGCGSDATIAVADLAMNPARPDLTASLPQCPPGVGAPQTVRCDPAVDTECVCGAGCYMARCLCNGWWETDAVLVRCDDMGGHD